MLAGLVADVSLVELLTFLNFQANLIPISFIFIFALKQQIILENQKLYLKLEFSFPVIISVHANAI